MKLGSEKMVSLTYFENIARTHARVSYSISGLMVIHFEKVRLQKMNMTLKILVEMMSPTCYCSVSWKTFILLSNSDFSSIRCSRKEVYEVWCGKDYKLSEFWIIVGTQAWLLCSFSNQIFLQLVEQEKECMNKNWGINIVKNCG